MDETKIEVSTKPRRRRFAISLRALMILVLLIGAFLGWRVRRASNQRRSVAAIKEVGGTIWYDYQHAAGKKAGMFVSVGAEHPFPAWLRGPIGDEYFQEPTTIFLNDSVPPNSPKPSESTIDAVAKLDSVTWLQTIRVPIGNATFAKLAGMPRLENVTLLDINMDDDGLACLESSPAIEHLCLRLKPSKITAKGIALIARQTRLKFLELLYTDLPDPASIAPLANLKRLEYLRLYNSPEDDACLEHLRGLTAMKVLDLRQTKLTDAGVDRLSGMTQLTILRVDGSKLTDACMAKLQANHPSLTELFFQPAPKFTDASLAIAAKLKSVTDLELPGSNVSDAGLDHLRGMKLVALEISGLGVTDAGVARLAGSNQFEGLGLTGTSVDGSDLSWLPGQTKLRSLSLDRSKVGDSSMAVIATAPSLMTLTLSETSLTDAGLATLKSATGVRYLDVRATKVTEQGLAAFRKARPKVMVESGPIRPYP